MAGAEVNQDASSNPLWEVLVGVLRDEFADSVEHIRGSVSPEQKEALGHALMELLEKTCGTNPDPDVYQKYRTDIKDILFPGLPEDAAPQFDRSLDALMHKITDLAARLSSATQKDKLAAHIIRNNITPGLS